MGWGVDLPKVGFGVRTIKQTVSSKSIFGEKTPYLLSLAYEQLDMYMIKITCTMGYAQ